ncbi:MAG: flavodoxin [Stomatobaculum sp.]|nr:flavodoxin [Stomatobaculum sp.]
MKKLIFLPLALLLALNLILTACGAQSASSPENTARQTEAAQETKTVQETTMEASQETTAEAVPSEEPAAVHKEVLVAYFSATGTTKGVAEKIAKLTDADIYEIVPAEPYTSDDLNYNDKSSRTSKEQNDKSARPAIGSDQIDLSGYTTIYIGFPIWWGQEPRIMDTFAESYDFTGITLIPFCTSGSSGIGRSGPNMEALAGTGTWLEGARHSGSISEADLQTWIDGYK